MNNNINYNSYENRAYFEGDFKEKDFININHKRELVHLINQIHFYINGSDKEKPEFNAVKKELININQSVDSNDLHEFNFIKEKLLQNLENKQSYLESIKDIPTNTYAQVLERQKIEKEVQILKEKLTHVISLISQFDLIKHKLHHEISKIPETVESKDFFNLETIKKTFSRLNKKELSPDIEFLQNIQKEYEALVNIYDTALTIEAELISEKSGRSNLEKMEVTKLRSMRLIHQLEDSPQAEKAKNQLKSELMNQSNLDISLIKNYLLKLNNKIIKNQLNIQRLETHVSNKLSKNEPVGDEIYERISYLNQKNEKITKKQNEVIEQYELISSTLNKFHFFANHVEKIDSKQLGQLFDKLIHNYQSALENYLADEQLLSTRKEQFLGLEQAKNVDPIAIDLLMHAYKQLKIESNLYLDTPNEFDTAKTKKLLKEIDHLVKHFVHSITFENESDFKKLEFAFIIDFLMKLQINTRGLPSGLHPSHAKLFSGEVGLFSSQVPAEMGPAESLKIWCMNYLIEKAAHVVQSCKKNKNEEKIQLIETIIAGYGWAIEDQANYILFGVQLTEIAILAQMDQYFSGATALAGFVSSSANLVSMAKENPLGKIKDEKLFLENLIAEKEKEFQKFPNLPYLKTLIDILKLRLQFISDKALNKVLYSIGANTIEFLNSAASVGGAVAGVAAPATAGTAVAATTYATAGVSVLLMALGGLFLYLNQKRSIHAKMRVEEQKVLLEGINKKLKFLLSNYGLPRHLAKGDPKLLQQYAGLNSGRFIHEYQDLQRKALACKQVIAKELDRSFIGTIADLDSHTRLEVEKIRNEIQKQIDLQETFDTLLDFFMDHAPSYTQAFKSDPATAILDYIYAT